MKASLLAVLLALASSAPWPDSPTDELAQRVERFRETGRGFEREDEIELRTLLRDIRGTTYAGDASRRRAAIVLLDMLAAGTAAAVGDDGQLIPRGEALRQTAEGELAWLIDDALANWLAGTILVASSEPVPRRVALARTLASRTDPRTVLALATCARLDEPEVRAAAFEALLGRDDDAMHSLFVRALVDPGDADPPALRGTAEAHFRRVRLPKDSPTAAALAQFVGERLLAENWRTSSLAVSVSHALTDELAVPLLIEALATWNARVDAGRRVSRIRHDILEELQRRSGRSIGPQPENWRTWWNATSSGAARRAGGEGEVFASEASFFGIRPVTDRVVFVLDRSGSMGWTMGGSKQPKSPEDTRYQRSIEQMLGFLENLGPEVQFNVVVFNDRAKSWRKRLAAATPRNLGAVKTWLMRQATSNGTLLRRGVELATELAVHPPLEGETLEADTLIILCDGETGGVSWIRPYLRSRNVDARLVVHCVQIGKAGDGALEALAAETGGQFARID